MKKILLAGLLLAGSLFAKEQTLLLGTRNITIKNDPIFANQIKQNYKIMETNFSVISKKILKFLSGVSDYKLKTFKELEKAEKFYLLANLLNKEQISPTISYLNVVVAPENKVIKNEIYIHNLNKNKVYKTLGKKLILLNTVKVCKKFKYNFSYYLIKNGFIFKEIIYTYKNKYNFLKKLYEIDVNKNTCQQINKNKKLWLKNQEF